jgi:excisionase family DNA binding protein
MTQGFEKMNRTTDASIDFGTIQELSGSATDSPLLVDFKTAARLIGVGVSTFYAMDRSGELGPQGIRLRRRRLWRRDELVEWVRAACPRRERWVAMSKKFREGA